MNRRKGAKKGRRTIIPWIVVLAFFMAELLGYSWCRVQYVQMGYEINQARQERQRLTALHQELKVEEARLRSPERIKRLAKKRGLVMPDSSQVVVLP
jgi:cell division protein FtsL